MVFVQILCFIGAVAAGNLQGVGDIAFGFDCARGQDNHFDIADVVGGCDLIIDGISTFVTAAARAVDEFSFAIGIDGCWFVKVAISDMAF